MSSTQLRAGSADPVKGRTTDMKLEVVVIPVSDVDRSKEFYESLGWRLDIDISVSDFRAVQFTRQGQAARSRSAKA